MSEVGLIKTGIKGLDSILLGGIPRTNVILVQGVTGSGKTLLGMEFIYPWDHPIWRAWAGRGI